MKNIWALGLGLFFSVFAHGNVRVYFNHLESERYTDPYRGITRPGQNLEKVLLDQIHVARKSIYIAVQELRLPLIAKALIAKFRQGVDVRIILENDYNFTVLSQKESLEEQEHESIRLADLGALVDVNRNGYFEEFELENRDAIYMLNQAGIPLRDDTSDQSMGSSLMHHKFMIVDEKVTVVSTANFTLSCIHGDMLENSSRGNPNSMVEIHSSAVAKIFLKEFGQMWGNGHDSGRFGLSKAYVGPQTVSVNGKNITIQFSPTSKNLYWEESVNGLIGSFLKNSKQSVYSALFVFSDQKIANVLQDLSLSGNKISVLIEPKFAYRYYSELLDLLGVQLRSMRCQFEPDNNPWAAPISQAGIPALNNGDVLHHKFAVVDNQTVIVGSQNWSEAANHSNDETLLVLEDDQLAQSYSNEFFRLKRNAFLGVPHWLWNQIQDVETNCQ